MFYERLIEAFTALQAVHENKARSFIKVGKYHEAGDATAKASQMGVVVERIRSEFTRLAEEKMQ